MRPEAGTRRKTREPWVSGQVFLAVKTDTQMRSLRGWRVMGALQALPQSVLPVHTGKSSSSVCIQSWAVSSPQCLARCLTEKGDKCKDGEHRGKGDGERVDVREREG